MPLGHLGDKSVPSGCLLPTPSCAGLMDTQPGHSPEDLPYHHLPF